MGKKGPLVVISLGLWLLVAPMSFGYHPSSMWMNDMLCGFLLICLGFFAMQTAKKWLIKGAAFIGFWLQLAPLIFWAPEAASYMNDTLVGMALMLLAFSLPGLCDEEKGEENPAGWSFNPSALGPRGVTVFLALIAWFLARYLASYQLGYIDEIKDPFFGDGTLKVISSSVAKMFPVSDAGLGAFGYSLECLLGLIGSSRRWKTMPWVSVFFGMMVIPAGMVSILLIVLQPVLVGAWCGICLLIAVCMLVMILLTIPELAATAQLLLKARKNRNFWSVFWHGDLSLPAPVVSPIQRNCISELGFTIPWNLVLTALLGVWLMCSPYLLENAHPAADTNYIAGPLLVAISIISFSEVIRSLRFVNVLIALGLIVSSFVFSGFSSLGWVNNLIVGVLIAVFSFPKGKRKERYGESK